MSLVPPACTARPATRDDLGAVAELLHRVFGVRQTVEFLRWKLTGCAGKLIGSTVLTAERRVVGFLGQIPVRVRVRGRELLAVQGADMGILEDYRRLDAFLSLVQTSVGELRREGVALTYGTANADAGTMTAELLGLRRLAPLPLLVRPLCAASLALGRRARALARVLSVWDCLSERTSAVSPDRLRLSRVERFDERFDAFWRKIQDDYPVMLARDAAYLNWRYADAPAVLYEKLGLENAASGAIEGYAVLGLRRRDGRLRGHIADLVTARNGDSRIVNLLIRAAVAWLRAQAAEVAEVWAFRHTPLRRALVRRGFVPRRTGAGGFQVSALACATEADLSAATRAENWLLAMGDSDMV